MSVQWSRYGSVLTGEEIEDESNAQEPNVLYDESMFKCWWTGGWDTPHINYSRSDDGLTWTDRAEVLDGYMHSYVFKVGSTFYLYAVPVATPTQIDAYSSANGVNWSLFQSAAINHGSEGQWDYGNMGNNCTWQEASNDWRMIYESRAGDGAGDVWKLGYATSTDGQSWTKYGSNPVISETGSVGGPFIYKSSDGIYYMWVHHTLSGFVPTDLERYKSTNLTSWTKKPSKDILKRLTADEGTNTSVGQVADPTILQYNNQVYMWYGATADGTQETGESRIKLVTSPMILEKLILTDEGI